MAKWMRWLAAILAVLTCACFPLSTLIPVLETPQPGCGNAPDCTATATPVATGILPTNPAATLTPQSTQTTLPTQEPSTPTAFATQIPTPTRNPFSFSIQPGTPLRIGNFAHPEAGCDWQGVAGQVFSHTGETVNSVVVVLSGNLNGTPVDFLGLTGLASDYGPGGFEIMIGTHPVDSSASLSIQLFNLEGNPVSPLQPLTTSSDCRSNLTVVNFLEIDG